MSNGGSL
jgi:hypothetical protein